MFLRVIRADGSFVRRVPEHSRLHLTKLGLVRPVGKRRVRALMLTAGEAVLEAAAEQFPPLPLNAASHTTYVERYAGQQVYAHHDIKCAAFNVPIRSRI